MDEVTGDADDQSAFVIPTRRSKHRLLIDA
jgi:hypothetical protein